MIAFPQVAAAASNWPRCCCRAASWLGLSVVTCLSCAESRIQLQLNLTGKMELRRAPREPDHLLWDPTSKKEQDAQRWVCGEPRSLLQCCDIEIWKYESRQVLTALHGTSLITGQRTFPLCSFFVTGAAWRLCNLDWQAVHKSDTDTSDTDLCACKKQRLSFDRYVLCKNMWKHSNSIDHGPDLTKIHKPDS